MGSRGVVSSGASFSPCRRYRYALWRDFAFGEGACAFIGVNPSTADEREDDPTIRRCINYALAWGFQRFVMLNLFAFRATDPDVMRAEPEPTGGIENDVALIEQSQRARLVVCAWGVHGEHNSRGAAVRAMLTQAGVPLHHLGLTKLGHPKHPLYLKSSERPQPWRE